MDRLTPLDVWFLHVEDGIDHMHMALVAVLEGPCPEHADVLADVAGRLDRIPRYRQRVRWAPLGLANPVWVDDLDFDVAFHVRRATTRPPGDDAALADLVGRLVGRELDRTRPLWEIWVVDGLAEGRWATIMKVHHSLTDGVGGSALVSVLVDASAGVPAPQPSLWHPEPAPSTLGLLVDDWRTRLDPTPARRAAAHALRSPGTTLDRMRGVVTGALTYARDLPPTSPTVLNGPLHASRRWWPASVARDAVDAIRRDRQVSLNDVALTIVTGGFRDLLLAHGESVEDRDVRSLVPVNLRRLERDGVLHNRVGAMVADLPVGIADPSQRLDVVHERLAALKASGETQVTASIVETSAHLPWPPVTTAMRAAARLLHTHVQRNVNTVTTNVPGPPGPLWWMGRRILRSWPVTPIGEAVRVGVAIYSYTDAVTFGVTTDREAVPDGHLVARGIERDLEVLAAASRAPAS